jgi:hypothetical protein
MMDSSKRKLMFMDIALALIVLALFGLAPLLTAHKRANDPDFIKGESDVRSGNELTISSIPRGRTHLL